MALVQHPPTKDWKVESVTDLGTSEDFRYRVEGLNLNYTPDDKDYRFTWRLRDLEDARFDFEGASWWFRGVRYESRPEEGLFSCPACGAKTEPQKTIGGRWDATLCMGCVPNPPEGPRPTEA